jgi:Double-GTPase 1
MGSIRVIGPKGSGKTTYLAALSYWTDTQQKSGKKPDFTINPIGDETKKLTLLAENIICEGNSLPPTDIASGIDSLPVYQFSIDVRRQLRSAHQINLAVRDYPGEIFDELNAGETDPIHQEFLDECLVNRDVQGCLILLNKWEKGLDKVYKRAFDKLVNIIKENDRTDLRLAIAMSKCERGELWPGRLEPEIDIFEQHFPETKALLHSKLPNKNLAFFALSTFGVLRRNDPRPNRSDEMNGKNSVLRKAELWRPYGMIAPLYWLDTGEKMNRNV